MTIISDLDRRVGHALASAPRSAGWSREQLAPAIGLGTSDLAQAEAGQRRLQTADLSSASEALGTSARPFLALIAAGDPALLDSPQASDGATRSNRAELCFTAGAEPGTDGGMSPA